MRNLVAIHYEHLHRERHKVSFVPKDCVAREPWAKNCILNSKTLPAGISY